MATVKIVVAFALVTNIATVRAVFVQGLPNTVLFECQQSAGGDNGAFGARFPAPVDCHSYYQCQDSSSLPIKMSCGFLQFNPELGLCDWPANVIRIRPQCDRTYKTFKKGLFHDAAVNTPDQSVIEPDDTSAEPSDDEAKEPRLFIVDGIQETATVKRRPTVLEVVLKPEVFVEGSKEYVYEEIGYDKVDYIEEEDDNSINDDTLHNESIESQGDTDLILTPLDARQESSRQLDRENVETAVHDSTLEELPFEAIEDYLVRNSARISSETIRLLNIQNNCDKEGETDRAFDLTDVANINQVQELQPLHKGRDETDQRRLIDEEVNFVDDQTATTSRTLDPTTEVPETTTSNLTESPDEGSDQSYYPTTTEINIFSILATVKPTVFAGEETTTTTSESTSTYYPILNGGENSSGDAGVTYYPVLEPDFFEESNKSANFTQLNFIEELNQDPSVQVEPFQSSIEEFEGSEDYVEITTASADEIAGCISQFLSCVESEEGDQSEDESSPCYVAFQDCSGSVILVPGLYQENSPSIDRPEGVVPEAPLSADESSTIKANKNEDVDLGESTTLLPKERLVTTSNEGLLEPR